MKTLINLGKFIGRGPEKISKWTFRFDTLKTFIEQNVSEILLLILYALLPIFHKYNFYRTPLITMFNTLMGYPVKILVIVIIIITIIIKITISSIVIGLKSSYFPLINFAKLLSDSLLLDSSISQSHSKS